jgi:type IV pilus assembly protein PilY1
LRVGITLAGALAMAGGVQAALTDLAPVPLITSSPQIVKPNLMFVLDDSGSMAWSHMPDTVQNFAQDGSGTAKYGYVSSQCNGVYYNPTRVYRPPVSVAANGAVGFYPDSSFTAAWVNGFNTGAGTVNLSTSFQAWTNSTTTNTSVGTPRTAAPAYYYRYKGSQTTPSQRNYLDTSSTFYNECVSLVGSATGSAVFDLVAVSATSGTAGVGPGVDERTNFANWYSYYRTRMLMMKTATGGAFAGIDDKFRVGYMSINNNVSNAFRNIADFAATQKYDWYTSLYGATPTNSTPLREALSNAGRIYANKISTLNGVAVTDPIQYSCQKNFTLLSTDGYWNGNEGFQVDGSTPVDNQDMVDPRPYNDGGTAANIYTTTVIVTSGGSSQTVSSMTVNGAQIMSASADSSGGTGSRSEKLARNITNRINNCTAAVSGACTVAGYSATRSGTTITITAPAAVTGTPVATANGGATATVTAFAGTAVASGGTSDTLADVAAYYYKTDLRSSGLSNVNGALGSSVVLNNVTPGGDDDATYQHMTTYTLGLGAPGRMIYSSSYKADTAGHYAAILNGSTATGAGGPCPWQASGTCTWPQPASGGNGPETIDDLWHAAVNGRGTYFSAGDAAGLSVGLATALQGINALTSDSAAASTSNPNVTSGDNYLFSSTFRTAEWYGEVERRQINVTTGVIAATPDWTAAAQLDANASRTIYTFDNAVTSTTKLKPFDWANLTTGERANFESATIGSTAAMPLSQFCAIGDTCLTAGAQTAASGQPLVDFLRGDRTNEGPANITTKYFRERARVLGDVVNSEAIYVKRPQFDYVDTGYSTFKTSGVAATRDPMVYVGANDGMLHAFYADTGVERWAYVPKLLFPTLYRLADKFYATKHQFYVDGSPTVGDVYFGGAWHTILVGGFNAGGRGYYALDVTDPANPTALWEFTDANMGYSYGRPEITKLADGTWVVLVTSGYNNVNPGNGQGYLYAIDAGTGAAIHTIGTGVGSATAAITGVCAAAPCPSGLAQIRAYVDNARYDNRTTKVYGSDLYGNVWRFDVNDTFGASGREAQLLASLRGPGGNVQSLMTRPEVGLVANIPVVFVGTGRYLGAGDLADATVQSIYAIKDSGGSTSMGNPRSDLTATGFVQQTLTTATCGASAYCTTGQTIRTGSTNAVNFATQKGWFIDLPGTGERANTDPQLALGTLAITTNVLDPLACSVGGSSFINFLDYRTGQAVSTANGMASVYLDAALATRTVQVKFADGSVRSIVRLSNNTTIAQPTPLPPNPTATRRTSWRELTTD